LKTAPCLGRDSSIVPPGNKSEDVEDDGTNGDVAFGGKSDGKEVSGSMPDKVSAAKGIIVGGTPMDSIAATGNCWNSDNAGGDKGFKKG